VYTIQACVAWHASKAMCMCVCFVFLREMQCYCHGKSAYHRYVPLGAPVGS